MCRRRPFGACQGLIRRFPAMLGGKSAPGLLQESVPMFVPPPDWRRGLGSCAGAARGDATGLRTVSWFWGAALAVAVLSLMAALLFLMPYAAASHPGVPGIAVAAVALAGSLLAAGLCALRTGLFPR